MIREEADQFDRAIGAVKQMGCSNRSIVGLLLRKGGLMQKVDG